MRVGVVGSRVLADASVVYADLDARFPRPHEITIVSGDCPDGADLHAKNWALSRGAGYDGLPAQWVQDGKYKPTAGFDRNTDIVEGSDWGIAFWDGKTNGTRDTIAKYKRAGKKCLVVYYHEDRGLADLFE